MYGCKEVRSMDVDRSFPDHKLIWCDVIEFQLNKLDGNLVEKIKTDFKKVKDDLNVKLKDINSYIGNATEIYDKLHDAHILSIG